MVLIGVQHMVLERSHQLTQHPQAHYINNRTMEVRTVTSSTNTPQQRGWLVSLATSCPFAEHNVHTSKPATAIKLVAVQVFRGLGDLCSRVKARSPPLEQWRRFIYCESMASGQLLGQVDHFPGEVRLWQQHSMLS